MVKENIHHHVIGMRGTKKQAIPTATLRTILSILLDPQNHPIMVHCSHGKVCAAMHSSGLACLPP
jgi:tyrosine-protein phosphatase SIW14